MAQWYSRPVVAVADLERALSFYLGLFGFREDWRFEEDGASIVQVSRQGCELILSNQWPERAGAARQFVSLDESDFFAMREETKAKGISREDRWGYDLVVVADPDGNELWFPYPASEKSS